MSQQQSKKQKISKRSCQMQSNITTGKITPLNAQYVTTSDHTVDISRSE